MSVPGHGFKQVLLQYKPRTTSKSPEFRERGKFRLKAKAIEVTTL
jgi:hypothetical protein